MSSSRVLVALLASAVLVGGSVVSAGAATTWRSSIERGDTERLSRAVDIRVNAFEQGMDGYENAVRSVSALYRSSERVSRSEFRRFARSLELDRRYPGMQALGFQAYVRGDDLPAFVRQARADGPRDFKVTPSGHRAEYFVVLYNEPASRFGKTWGFDARMNPTVRPYLERARDSGRTVLSGKAVLGTDLALPKDQQPVSFGLFVPVYRPGVPLATVSRRRRAFLGWASSPFRAREFLTGAIDGLPELLGIELFDGPARSANLIARHRVRGQSGIGMLRSLDVAGRRWTARMTPKAGAYSSDARGPEVLLIGGIALSALLAALMVLLARQRAHNRRMRETEGLLIQLAEEDSLTGLWNRRRFEQELERQAERSRRYHEGGALLVLDLDNFKHVNDSHGHHIGDDLLTAVADQIRHRLRLSDSVARLGGDEFAALLINTGPDDAAAVAEDIAARIRAVVIQTPSGPVQTTASIGIAFLGDTPETGDALLVRADLAMYDAKAAGRDQAITRQTPGARTRDLKDSSEPDGRPTIAVVHCDDSESYRRLVKEMLEARGGIQLIAEASTHLDTIEATAQTSPDVVLLDLDAQRDPHIMQSLRSAAPAARIIVLSGIDGAADDPLVAGADGFVSKTESFDALAAAVTAAVPNTAG